MKYSLLINTCDNFEDCWIPFFKLFSIYWPDFKGKIYLNTEYKEFSYPGLEIICTKVCLVNNVPKSKRATWSQCLKWALEQIDTDIVLYMQEDYFLKDSVKNDIIENFVSLINEKKDIDCIHLTDQAVIAENLPSHYHNLYPVKLNQKYRISCQAALWKKDVLSLYIRTYENAWQFEEFGSKRARKLKHNFYVIDNKKFKINENEIIPYVFTGIIQGRWKDEVNSLFESNNISIDYHKRGFVSNNNNKNIRRKLADKLTYIYVYFRYFLN